MDTGSERVPGVRRSVLAGEGSVIQPIKDAHQVLIAGAKPQVLEALDVLRFMDSPTPPAVEAFRVRNSTATAVTALLERVTKAMEQVGRFKPEGLALAEPTSGVILVVAPEPELTWWKEAIERFDEVPPAVHECRHEGNCPN